MPAFCYTSSAHGPIDDAILSSIESRLAPAHWTATRIRHPLTAGTLSRIQLSHVPQSTYASPDGGFALLVGEAVPEHSDRRFTAEEVFIWVRNGAPARGDTILRGSGYFAWVVIEAGGAVSAGADPYGMFPLFWLHAHGTFALATSIMALRQLPAYNRQPDLVGVARHLIENGCAGTRTIERGSTRLDTGQVLRFHHGEPCVTIENRRMDWLTRRGKITDPSEALALSCDASARALRRMVQPRPAAMLMSGGLDSRHLGALAVREGWRPDCLTFGHPADFESSFARRATRTMRCQWRCLADHWPEATDLVRMELDLNGLAGGFSSITMNGSAAVKAAGYERVFTGLCLDDQYSPMLKGADTHPVESFEYSMDRWINRFGVPALSLLGMARPDGFSDAVSAALAEIRAEWEQLPGDTTDRLWQTILRYRMRPHLGGHLWKQAFHIWPQLPALDLPFGLAMRSVDGTLLKGRALQRNTVAHLHPALARIPLDAIADAPTSILPNRLEPVHTAIFHLRRRYNRLPLRATHRFPRIMDMNSPVWRDIRVLSEPGRGALESWFDPAKLSLHVPAPGQNDPSRRSPLAGQGGYRMLWGLMLWVQT